MNRSTISVSLILLVIFALGCATSKPKEQPIESTDPPESVDPAVVGRLDVAVDSAAALYDFGDVDEFETARDSLRMSMEALATTYPELRSDPDFQRVLNSLTSLDSMFVSDFPAHEQLSEVDSLALLVEPWPEADTTEADITLSANGDTLFPTIRNDRIDFWIRYFTGPGRDWFSRSLYRTELYRPTVETILDELGLPPELIAVAIIESGFHLKARSRARAVGPWQFIAGTARIYGLRVNWWYDERRDIIASTYAAGNYLNDLYGIWESWPLALASYNCGEYRVARAVATHKTTNFWKLRLPKQTERYVPKFLATLYILREPERYGFTIPDVEPIKYDEVTIKDATDIKLIAKSADTTVDLIRDLNPALTQWATPPKMTVRVKVPPGTSEICEAALKDIPPEERVTWRKHKIRQGETLSTIASKYNTSISALKQLNGIRNAHRIRAGKYLIVPIQGTYTEVAATEPRYTNTRRKLSREDMERYAARYAPPANHKRVVYKVKSGDTLGQIAEDYNTRASKLRSWNNLSYRSYIYAGQKLVIYVPDSFDLSKAPSTVPDRPDEKSYTRSSYVIKKGDTMYSISKKFNVNMADLLAWNNKSSRSKIYPGQKINVWQKK